MAKNTSFPPIKDGVKADNTTYSSNKIEEIVSTIESEIPALPEPAVGDIDKVIGITSDGSTGAEYGLITIENELPTPSSSNKGKVAIVTKEGSSYKWDAGDYEPTVKWFITVSDYSGYISILGITAQQFQENFEKNMVVRYIGDEVPNYATIDIACNNVDIHNLKKTFLASVPDANGDPSMFMIIIEKQGNNLVASKKKFSLNALEDITGTLIPDVYIEAVNGEELEYAGWSATDYIEVSEGENIIVVSAGASPYNAWYDSSKVKTTPSGMPGTVDAGWNPVTIAAGVSYYRYSGTTADMARVKIFKVNS